ncbi:hypothetical protein [Bradyrhizobium sp. Ai1a-2]|uniref:hypothetical protein n=1 Tax=Bradyrhizobium sp. Ai1a-2 TaxID=196490 RepID=UPI0003F63680|nr:hypothetical protein [Bradyrhizobium sp. Ai1a-2]
MQPLRNLPEKLKSAQVLVRFCFRLLILTGFALFGSIGFGRSLIALLWMSTILCAVMALMRRERFMGVDLNHWDEMAGYAALCALASAAAGR